MKITRITVVEGMDGMDQVVLHTDLPPSHWTFNAAPTFKIDIVEGSGQDWVAAYLEGYPTEVVNLRRGNG